MKKKLAKLVQFDPKTNDIIDYSDPEYPTHWGLNLVPKEIHKNKPTLFWLTAESPKTEGTVFIKFLKSKEGSFYLFIQLPGEYYFADTVNRINAKKLLGFNPFKNKKKIKLYLTPVL